MFILDTEAESPLHGTACWLSRFAFEPSLPLYGSDARCMWENTRSWLKDCFTNTDENAAGNMRKGKSGLDLEGGTKSRHPTSFANKQSQRCFCKCLEKILKFILLQKTCSYWRSVSYFSWSANFGIPDALHARCSFVCLCGWFQA